MKRRTKVIITAALLAAIVAPSVVLVPQIFQPPPYEVTGFYWQGTYHDLSEELWLLGAGVHYTDLYPPSRPPSQNISEYWQPSEEELLEMIANPDNVYMGCQTHGGTESLLTKDGGRLYTENVKEAMKDRPPFCLVILNACSAGSRGLPAAFTHNFSRHTAVIACRGIPRPSRVTEIVDYIFNACNDPTRQDVPIKQLFDAVGPTHPDAVIQFFGDPKMTPGDIFAIFLGDVNGFYPIDSADMQLIAQHIVGTIKLTGHKAVRADVNEDDVIDCADMQLIAQHIVSGIELPVR